MFFPQYYKTPVSEGAHSVFEDMYSSGDFTNEELLNADKLLINKEEYYRKYRGFDKKRIVILL